MEANVCIVVCWQ